MPSSFPHSRLLAGLLLVFVGSFLPNAGASGPPPTPGRGRTDRYGDPLPAGAYLRLGTTRLRHGGAVDFVAFARDGKTVVSAGRDGWVRTWDAGTGKQLHAVRCPEGHRPEA